MRITLDRLPRSAVICAIGVWDPVLECNRKLFRQLAKTSRSEHYTSVIVTLDPPPAMFNHGRKEWATFDNLAARLSFQRNEGIDTTIVARISHRETKLGARWFFDVLSNYVDIAQIWLGARQSLGPDHEGSSAAILEYASRRKIRVVRLPNRFTRNVSGRGREWLRIGSVCRARKMSGVNLCGESPPILNE